MAKRVRHAPGPGASGQDFRSERVLRGARDLSHHVQDLRGDALAPESPGRLELENLPLGGLVAGISKISLDSFFGAVQMREMLVPSCVSSSVHYEETPLLRSQTRRLSGSRPSHSLVATLALERGLWRAPKRVARPDPYRPRPSPQSFRSQRMVMAGSPKR
jgi:hypothetical protein